MATSRHEKALKSFTGLCSFLRAHVKDYAKVVNPLLELLRRYKPEKLQWKSEHQEAFDELKRRLTCKPVLCPPNPYKEFEIFADSSERTLGAVLMQKGDDGSGALHIVSYASRKLIPREVNYPIVEKEILSIIFSLAKFHEIVFGRRLIVWTDHKALTHLKTIARRNNRLARWALILSEYDLDLRLNTSRACHRLRTP